MNSPFANTMLDSLNVPNSSADQKGWGKMYPSSSKDAMDMMSGLMQFDPGNRLTATEGLKHAYCAQFHDPDSEHVANKSVEIPYDDNKKRSTADYRDKLYAEITNAPGKVKKR